MGTVDRDANADRNGGDEVSLQNLTLDQFKAVVNTTFQVRSDAGAGVELKLVEAIGVASRTGSQSGQNFSIVFKGPADPFLPQRMYSIEHDVLGRFDLFMVPVGQEPDGFQYQAIFNRAEDAS